MGIKSAYKRLKRRRYKQGVSIRHRVVGGRTGALRQKQRAGMLKEIKKRKEREQRLAASAATKVARLGVQSGTLNRGNLVSTPSSTGSAANVTPKKKREHRAPKPPIVPVNNLGAVLEKSPVTVAILQQRIAELEAELVASNNVTTLWVERHAASSDALRLIKTSRWYRVGKTLRLI